jgi:hypothetical protein
MRFKAISAGNGGHEMGSVMDESERGLLCELLLSPRLPRLVGIPLEEPAD